MSNPHAQHYKSDNPFLSRAYALQNPDEARTLYNEWAQLYDKDLSDQDYVLPTHAANAILANLPTGLLSTDDNGKKVYKVLDAGCGTGLVAVQLRQLSASSAGPEFTIDGLDISPGMLDIARKTGFYNALDEADLSKPIAREDDIYDIVACVGTLTAGHVGPAVIPEFVRVVKKGGVIVASILEAVWEIKGFKAEVERLEGEAKVRLESSKAVGIVGDKEEGGRIIVLRKL